MTPGRAPDDLVARLRRRLEELRGIEDPLAPELAELAAAYIRLDERLAKIIAIGDKYEAASLENAARLRDALEQLEKLRVVAPLAPQSGASIPLWTGTRRGLKDDSLLERLDAALSGFAADPLAAEGSTGALVSVQARDLALVLKRYRKTDARLEKIVAISDRYQSQLREVSQRMDFMSRTDPLTGLSNRRDMMERLEAESSRFERYGVPFSVLIFDLDDFKLVNDRFGHGSGDRVLRNVASVFRRELRQSDCCSRWGGEEFLILCPGTDLGGATSVGEKCRTAIADARVELREGEVSVTASGGVCAMKPGYDVDGLIRRADEALYRAKAAGKGVLVASP